MNRRHRSDFLKLLIALLSTTVAVAAAGTTPASAADTTTVVPVTSAMVRDALIKLPYALPIGGLEDGPLGVAIVKTTFAKATEIANEVATLPGLSPKTRFVFRTPEQTYVLDRYESPGILLLSLSYVEASPGVGESVDNAAVAKSTRLFGSTFQYEVLGDAVPPTQVSLAGADCANASETDCYNTYNTNMAIAERECGRLDQLPGYQTNKCMGAQLGLRGTLLYQCLDVVRTCESLARLNGPVQAVFRLDTTTCYTVYCEIGGIGVNDHSPNPANLVVEFFSPYAAVSAIWNEWYSLDLLYTAGGSGGWRLPNVFVPAAGGEVGLCAAYANVYVGSYWSDGDYAGDSRVAAKTQASHCPLPGST